MAERLAEALWRNCCWPGRRGGEPIGKQLLAGALMRMAGVFLAEMQLAVRAVAQKHREEASGKRVQDWQAGARLASGFTIGRRVELALDEQMHDGQASARLASGCRVTFVWVVRLGDTSCLLLPLGRRGFGAAVCLWRSSGRGGTLLL